MSSIEDAGLIVKCFIGGAKHLESNKAYINELNVFPVPDGDTGTNMTMTVMSAARALTELKDPELSEVAKTMSSGSLRGARGNSGVIMSQLIRGFCKTIGSESSITNETIAAGFERAVETAYKAVMRPKEGTILTVARGISDKISELYPVTEDTAVLLREALDYGREVLAQTPELLPVLKEAGVVDSGGTGLIEFLEGAVRVLEGEDVSLDLDEGARQPAADQAGTSTARGPISTDDIKYGYCTEFIVNLDHPLRPAEVMAFRAYLESMGDSVVLVDDDELIKVHVHTNHPGAVFEKGLEIGSSLSRMKVDNMREEHEEKLIANASEIASGTAAADTDVNVSAPEDSTVPEERAESAFIAICTGKGFESFFHELGVSEVLEGGQTMNPSTEDILQAVERANAEHVFILPNNKNIILAAEQAAKIAKDSVIHVVPTSTIPQGIAAVINFMEGEDPEANMEAMLEGIAAIKTGELTYAVRNTLVDGKEIKEGDIMGIGDRGILAVGEILNDTALSLIDELVDNNSSIVTIYVGEDIDDESAEMLSSMVSDKYPDLEVETERGDQPVYYYIVSVE